MEREVSVMTYNGGRGSSLTRVGGAGRGGGAGRSARS